LGYQSEIVPLTEIQYQPLDSTTKNEIAQSEWLFFTSQAAVKQILPWTLPQTKIAVIGENTAAEVRAHGRKPTFISPVATKVAMLDNWRRQYPEKSSIFYPKSQLADTYLEEQLQVHYQVTTFIAYQNHWSTANQQRLTQLLKRRQLSAIYFTSPSAWHRFYSVYQKELQPLTFFTIGATTQQAIQADGYSAEILVK
jgi:uroporphyrinogen-III synthase